MNYLVIGEHKFNSSDSWKEHLVFSSDNTEDWTEKDYIEFFQENDGDAVVDYILKTEESIPTLEITDPLVSRGGG